MINLSRKEIIAKRIAQEFKDGMIVNLGVGIPTLIPAFVPRDIKIWLESENGILGMGSPPEKGKEDPLIVDAGRGYTTIAQGGSIFDSSMSFGIIRGGHVDLTVLGAFQVDQEGNLANWIIPGGRLAGVGGAMDLVTGAKKVIIATEHCSKDGRSKILKKCDLPLTGAGVVDMIVTELGVFEITSNGMELKEIAPGLTIDQVIAKTDADLYIQDNVTEMNI